MNEIEELYQLLQGKVKTGSLEEFTQRMQDPKSLAAVKKYAQDKIKPATQQPATQQPAPTQQEIPVQGQPKQGELRMPTQAEEAYLPQAPQRKITGYEGLKPSELAAVKSQRSGDY